MTRALAAGNWRAAARATSALDALDDVRRDRPKSPLPDDRFVWPDIGRMI
jgi:hypothetical protein